MGVTCHHCKSEDVFFDGELYQCLHCSYMWMPEITPKEYGLRVREEIKKKEEVASKHNKKDNSDI